jgi:hypothetical protein
MKNQSKVLIHIACIATIVGLSAFLVLDKSKTYNNFIENEWQSSFHKGAKEVRISTFSLFFKIRKQTQAYRNPKNQDFANRAKITKLTVDTLLNSLTELKHNHSKSKIMSIKENLKDFYSKTLILTDSSKGLVKLKDNFQVGFLNDKLEKCSKNELNTITEVIKLQLVIMECHAMSHFAKKVGWEDEIICNSYEPTISFNEATPSIGDTVNAQLMLSTFLRLQGSDLVFKLNGRICESSNTWADFSVKYDKPGVYPLHFVIEKKDWETDSVSIYEKTYSLRVR